MKTMRIALAATAVSVMVVAAFASLEQGPLPAPSPATRTIKPGTQLPVFVPGTLVASPTRLSIVADSGVRTAVTFAASYTGTGGVLDVQTDTAHLSDPIVTPLGDGRFSITLQTSDLLAEGSYRGTLRLRMCADAGCTNPITGATTAVQYTQRMRWVNPGEWETWQGDAGHRGHVPVVVDPLKIRKAWEWSSPTQVDLLPVATSRGHVYVAEALAAAGYTRLFKLREGDATEAWRLQFPNSAMLSSPAVSAGNVYLGVAGSTPTRLFGYRDADAAPLFQSIVEMQGNPTFPPVVSGDKVFVGAGHLGGGTLRAYNGQTGVAVWSRTVGDDWSAVPAVDGEHVYQYAFPDGLQVFARDNGNWVGSIYDPLTSSNGSYGYSYEAGPVLGADDEVFALSGNGAYPRFIVAYAPSTNSARWSSTRKYVGAPAYKDGVLYAGAMNPIAFDAIDAATGTRLWSWVPGPETTNFRGNIIVTRNLAFVSTNAALHAIDLRTRQSVWSIPTPGTIAMSGEGTLYLLPFAAENQPWTPPKLLAYRLR